MRVPLPVTSDIVNHHLLQGFVKTYDTLLVC
jgi:hypothetical protein